MTAIDKPRGTDTVPLNTVPFQGLDKPSRLYPRTEMASRDLAQGVGSEILSSQFVKDAQEVIFLLQGPAREVQAQHQKLSAISRDAMQTVSALPVLLTANLS